MRLVEERAGADRGSNSVSIFTVSTRSFAKQTRYSDKHASAFTVAAKEPRLFSTSLPDGRHYLIVIIGHLLGNVDSNLVICECQLVIRIERRPRLSVYIGKSTNVISAV